MSGNNEQIPALTIATESAASTEKKATGWVQNYVFGAILVLFFILVCRLFAPFFTVLLWSIFLYVLLNPLHKLATKNVDFGKIGGRILKNVWAAVFAVGTVIVILIPLSFTAFQFFKQIVELIRFGQDLFMRKPDFIQNSFQSISDFIADVSAGQLNIEADELQRRVTAFLNFSLQGALQFSRSITMNVSSFFINLVFMVFCLFFFYVDGAYLSRLALHIIPIRKEYMVTLTGKFSDVTKNLFFGYIIVSLIQAIMAGVIFSIFNIKGSLVFAALTFICVFVPMIGGGLVWGPLGIALIMNGQILKGVVFLIVSALFISTLDNFLRPLFLQDRIKLHPLIIFFAILGGLRVFGFNGLILGPMIVIFFLTVLDLFLMEHKIQEY
ncbi:MAG: AI-2E family transporter [Treponema sp.]|jgi:predicted PurR-regulated permease PerM|nr:AI-2E family transporter [Treponema sp.]